MLRKGFKRNFLMFLALLGDVAQELSYDTFYKRLYWPDYTPSYLSRQISRMLKVKTIKKKIIKGEPVFQLTAQGARLLDDSVPLRKLSRKKWDGVWRMVIFDIKEEKRYRRDRLRKKLLELGLGKWQRSVYITPHDVLQEMNEFLAAKKLFPRSVCLEARRVGFGDDQTLANHVFKLDKLNLRYQAVLDGVAALRQDMEEEKLESINKVGCEFQKIWGKYRNLMLDDPYLPQGLLPGDWVAEEVRKGFSRLSVEVSNFGASKI
ncbi:MAG: CRISPR-associated endonuclease Cas2 [Candidatus Aerophobetes bacterium]|nr:CRISPR-associated endonuclease Cas2 [Candidatus Aerophobetes bacterium]